MIVSQTRQIKLPQKRNFTLCLNRSITTTKLIIFVTLSLLVFLLIYNGWSLPDQTENSGITAVPESEFNVWLIFTKAKPESPLNYKFRSLLWNLLNVSSVPLKFHVIVDSTSKQVAESEMRSCKGIKNKTINYFLYDMQSVAASIQDIVAALTPHFSSKPGTYYSDALFYISLGLHRIAPQNQTLAVMLDCDLHFKKDIKLLFNEFISFDQKTLFGLAHELTPVYLHNLYSYRQKNPNSTLGEYYHREKMSSGAYPHGFQGYNSGVLLLHLGNIRKSELYSQILSKGTVNVLTNKYHFRGHLGDQDFYTLVAFEYPSLFKTLNCRFNRQLCTWWRDHGYSDIFYKYFNCDEDIVVLHGNCNTKIIKS